MLVDVPSSLELTVLSSNEEPKPEEELGIEKKGEVVIEDDDLKEGDPDLEITNSNSDFDKDVDDDSDLDYDPSWDC